MQTRSRYSRAPERRGRDGLRRIVLSALLALSASAVAEPFAEWREPVSGMTFVNIPDGCFEQGETRPGPTGPGILVQWPRADEIPPRRSCVGRFWLAKTEVTVDQWARVMALPGSGGDSSRPRTDVSWEDAQEFVSNLNRRLAHDGLHFRLPTEVEWEYACQAGRKAPAQQLYGEERAQLALSIEREACFFLTMERDPKSCDVASRRPNAWGLHDMLGNVWEWVEDRYAADAYRHPPATAVPGDGNVPRVLRGGSFKSDVAQVRCGARNHAPAADRSIVIGLRPVLERREK